MTKKVHVLCDHDALFAAIELKLSSLPQVHVVRLVPDAFPPLSNRCPSLESALIIVAPVPPIHDAMSVLSRAALLDCVGRVPVLIISEQPSRPESADRITYLNFPFDMDDLNSTVAKILNRHPQPDPQHVLPS